MNAVEQISVPEAAWGLSTAGTSDADQTASILDKSRYVLIELAVSRESQSSQSKGSVLNLNKYSKWENSCALMHNRHHFRFHQQPADTHHGNRFTGQHLASIHHDVISDVGQNVDDRDNRHGDGNGQRQIPATDDTRNLFFSALHLRSESPFFPNVHIKVSGM